MNNNEIKDTLTKLADQQAKLTDSITALSQRKHDKKDIWDKFSAISTFLSGVLIAVIGLYFTYVYDASIKEQQLKITELQTLEHLIPQLSGSEEKKKIAILSIHSLGNTALAARLTELNPSEGSVAALSSIAQHKSEASKTARLSLGIIFSETADALLSLNKDKSLLTTGMILNRDGLIIEPNIGAIEKIENITIEGRKIPYERRVYLYKNYRTSILDSNNKVIEVGIFNIYDIPGFDTSYFNHEFANSDDILKAKEVIAINKDSAEEGVSGIGLVQSIDDIFITISFDKSDLPLGDGPVIDFNGNIIGLWSGINGKYYRGDVLQNELEQMGFIRKSIVKQKASTE